MNHAAGHITNLVMRLLSLSLTSLFLYGQEPNRSTNFLPHTALINPSFVGIQHGASLVFVHRNQWLGIDGAPKTQLISFQGPLSNKRMAVGVSLLHDQIGPLKSSFADTDFSYRLTLSEKSALQLGLKITAHLTDVNFSLLKQDYSQGQDPVFNLPIDNHISPNFGLGLLYIRDQFYVSISVPSFLETLDFEGFSRSQNFHKVQVYAAAGTHINYQKKLSFRPSVFIHSRPHHPIQVDFNVLTTLNKKFTAGIRYRVESSLSGLFSYQVSPSILMGLSYDRSATSLGTDVFNSGSFEAMLRYTFKKAAEKSKPDEYIVKLFDPHF